MPASNEEFIKKAFESGLTEEQVKAAVAERNAKMSSTKPGLDIGGIVKGVGNFVAGGAERMGKGLGTAIAFASPEVRNLQRQTEETRASQNALAKKKLQEAIASGDPQKAREIARSIQVFNAQASGAEQETLNTVKTGREDLLKGAVQTTGTLAAAGLIPGSVTGAMGTGALVGGTSGFGQSKTGEEVSDTLMGAGTGVVLGGVLQFAGQKFASRAKKVAGIEVPEELATTAEQRTHKFLTSLENIDDTELRVPRTFEGKTIQGMFNLTPTRETKLFRPAETSEVMYKNGYLGMSTEKMQQRSRSIVDGLNGFVKDAVGEASPVPPKSVAKVANDVDSLITVGKANGMTKLQAETMEQMLKGSLGVDKRGVVANALDASSMLQFQKQMQELKVGVSFANPQAKELRAIYQGAADAAQEAVHDSIQNSPKSVAVVEAVKAPELLNALRKQGFKGLADQLERATSYQDIRSAMWPFVRSSQILELLSEKGVKGAGVGRIATKGIGALIGAIAGPIGAVGGAVVASSLDPVTDAVTSSLQPKLSGMAAKGIGGVGRAIGTVGQAAGAVMRNPQVQQGTIRAITREGGGGAPRPGLDIMPRYLYR